MTTGRINQITILKEEATSSKKRNRNLFFSHLFPLARRYLLSLETAEIPEKLLFQVSLLPEMLSVQKAFTLLTSALRHHTIALFEFPSNQVPPNRYPGVSRNGTFDIADLRGGYLEESQSCDRLFNKAFPQV
ncbi:ALI_HP2_G0035770.mRNA.1.CDS.1 [Saccharomyces cerevisiae]|nr:ALI_HP2_G0035770.mRNA.1.CDS.1 [Saccharomyces cerevisiae]CAI6577415.1 ALI_HP2_G0035770.mRNA.1.CDS.1 [Saccharomyces cerevisiae]